MSDAPEKAAAVPQLNDEPVVQEKVPEAVQAGAEEVVDQVTLIYNFGSEAGMWVVENGSTYYYRNTVLGSGSHES